ncbi:Tetratricopeptide-like helical [Metarhizium album ARSEF 1941]|uniref:Tetratricopeptide-like helical n=1 Tax=Metarhizium album (strain ARSEF 1941) TaxID=1081103 RepID=A0A0B2X6U9_METAS|nr:Tetratricopeptide-like helical [Metarhizium album ARSEF 1941]KHO01021.1 Tetratricopeptide-like helical [Metarhizium album ARSEF 1941]
MSSAKAALRAVNDAIRGQDYDGAINNAKELLNKDPKSYLALVFLAFALDKKNQLGEAEIFYNKATELRPQDAQAFQGLIKLYEKQGNKKFGEYQSAVVSLARIYHEADDLYKAQDVVDKFVDFAKVNGDKLQYADALWIQLPESALYSILEGRLPHPAKTYETIAHILEDFEKQRINTLVGERRTRLGAKLSEVKAEAKREVYAQSRLEHIYRQLINWTNDDDVRRDFEEKLLQYCHDRLLVTPPGLVKTQEQAKVFGLANDMVAIKHPFKLAWDIAIDWQDGKDIKSWDVALLRDYCTFFPNSDMYKVITAFLTSNFSPFPSDSQGAGNSRAPDNNNSSDSEDDEDGGVPITYVPLTDEDRLMMISEGITGSESVFAYRLAGVYFLQTGEYESTVEVMRKARVYLGKERTKVGISYENTGDAYALCLATSLVYFQSPRHHQEAKQLFDKVLERDSTSTSALIGVGLIFEEEEEYDQAIDFLERALKRDASNLRVKSEAAWVKALKGDWQTARDELSECLPTLEKNMPLHRELLADTQYRIGCCIWNSDTSRQSRKQRKGDAAYAYWLSALSNNMHHAPTYTSLGIFYSDYAKDKKRARRCFQKALELSAAEVVSAERLARSFAEDGDWERVELVAQRIIDSGKVKPPPGSKRKGISWPFAAMGVAQLNKQDFHKAIVCFQAALRISPNDYHSWVGLGESYHSSGRYIAATKAIVNAQALEEHLGDGISTDVWFTKYMLANIKRELGEYDESITLYKTVVETHPKEQGVVIALMQTMVDSALTCVEKGLFGRAVQLAADTIEFASQTPGDVKETFNFWKSVADATSVFASVQSRIVDFPASRIKKLLEDTHQEAFELLASVDKVGTEVISAKGIFPNDEQLGVDMTRCIHATILCHKEAIHVSADKTHAQAVAHYNLGWAEYRAHACLPAQMRRKPSNYITASVKAFKRAIELESGNADFWNALGVVTSEINPAVSQHAFVRSLHLNERSPVGWTNLGVLALLSGDTELADEAFARGQSADPEYAHAWLGRAFLALLYGEVKEARSLFTHAMEIAEASSVPTRKHYSSALFDHILTAPANMTAASLIQPLFALGQVQSMLPHEYAFGHLSSLFNERTRDSVSAVKTLEKLCGMLEADYETTESRTSLARFTLARTDLARAYLAAGAYAKAIECGEMALGLSSDDADSELTGEQRKRARLSSHLTVGLGQYYLGQHREAETYFEAALEESDHNPNAACLLAQVLWAQGTESSRDKARETLFEVIERQPDDVQSVLSLGVVALLDQDESSLEAVVEELQGLRTNDSVSATQQSQIGEVLQAIAGVAEGHTRQDMVQQVQQDVMLYPHLPHGWSSLAEATGDKYAAQMALKVASRGIPPRGILEAQDLARAYAGTGKAADAQKAAFLSPWDGCGWTALRVKNVLLPSKGSWNINTRKHQDACLLSSSSSSSSRGRVAIAIARPSSLLQPGHPPTHPGLVPGFDLAAQQNALLRRQQQGAAGDGGPGPQQHLAPYTRPAHVQATYPRQLDGVRRGPLAILHDKAMRGLVAGHEARAARARRPGRRIHGPTIPVRTLVIGVGHADDFSSARLLAPLCGLQLLDLLPATEAQVLHVDELHVRVVPKPDLLDAGAVCGRGEGAQPRAVEARARREVGGEQARLGGGDERGQRRLRRAGGEGGEEGRRGRRQALGRYRVGQLGCDVRGHGPRGRRSTVERALVDAPCESEVACALHEAPALAGGWGLPPAARGPQKSTSNSTVSTHRIAMSTIASPRDSPAPPRRLPSETPSSSGRPSLEVAQPGVASPVKEPPAPAGKRSNRAALREYYRLRAPRIEVAGSEVPPSDLDAPDFNAAEYVARVVANSGLEDLLRLYAQVVGEVRALDAEKKALVYDNYSKLIAATETIRKMRANMDPLNPMASTLDPAIAQIYSQASSIRERLRETVPAPDSDQGRRRAAGLRRQRTRELAVEVLATPRELRRLVGEGKIQEARRRWEMPRRLLSVWRDMGVGGDHVQTCIDEGDAVLSPSQSNSGAER